jgi:uncharacterized membrane protein
VMSPLFVIGGMIFFKAVARVAKLPFTKKWKKASLTVLSLFLTSFLLFNSGWIYTITNDNPTQFALNSHIDAPRFSDQEVLAAQWMVGSKGDRTELYGDEYGHLPFLSLVGQSLTFYPYTTFARGADVIILLRSTNLAGKITIQTGYASLNDSLFYQKSLVNSNLVYDNGGARAYHP